MPYICEHRDSRIPDPFSQGDNGSMARRVLKNQKQAPLPQRAGIDPVSLILPENPGETLENLGLTLNTPETLLTISNYLTLRFYPGHPEVISARFERREVVSDTGEILHESTLYRPGEKIWYYRELADEPALSDDIPILYEDEHILAVDKPHFLPTTPRGSYIAQTALTKLRVRERNPLLIPIHRLDRPTAGVLLFAKTIQARAPFQTMFQNRHVSKSYLAVAPLLPDAHALAQARAGTLQVTSRITKVRDELQVRQLSAAQCQESGEQTNTLSRIELLDSYSFEDTPGARQLHTTFDAEERIHPASFYPASDTQLGLYRLHPHTGKTHQLRAHMNLLGTPLLGDVLYPNILPAAPDEQALPLQLLAYTLDFEHPVTGEDIHLQSQQSLAFAPLAER